MTQVRLLALIGFFIIFTALILPVCFSNTGFMEETTNIIELEDALSSSSVFSYLKEKDVPLDVLNGHSGRKNVDLPFTGFIQNLGQINDGSIEYYYSTHGLSIGFSRSHITFVGQSPEDPEPISFALSFSGSQDVVPVGVGKMNHLINYFYGDMQLTNVPSWKEVWYYDLYSGIDLRYYMSRQGLKYDFVVHPGADPSQITVQVSESMTLAIESQSISLQCRHPSYQISLQDTALRVYQADNTPVASQFILKDAGSTTYGFQVASFDPTQVLIIDPLLLVFSTYLGGSDSDRGLDIAVDNDGNSYIVGETGSSNFPIHNANDSTYNGNLDVFVTKLNAPGNGLVFSTYVGGGSLERGRAIVVDAEGNSYVTGQTYSSNFPTKNAYQSTPAGGDGDIFVFKLNPTGNELIFSTYLGGSDYDGAWDMVVDASGNTYVTGSTGSTDFPTKNAYDNSFNSPGYSDAYVFKLNASGNGLVFSTFLGGVSPDWGCSIAVDATGNCYVLGATESSNFPIQNAYQSNHGGLLDNFITKLNATGNGLVFSTYLGGAENDWGDGAALAVDTDGNSYITSSTGSADFPTKNAYNSTISGGFDAFVTKLNATGNGLVFSTFLGGSYYEHVYGITLDAAGNSYITGVTSSSDFPVSNAYQNTPAGGNCDGFVTKLNATGTGLIFSTYLGGSGIDYGQAVVLDVYKNTLFLHVTGYTNSIDFPTQNAYNSTPGGEYYDAFVTKFEVSSVIILNNPANNSLQQSGTVIDLAILDDNRVTVFYSWDGTAFSGLSLPYDVTLPAGEEQHILRVVVEDSQGYWGNVTFVFTTDDTAPVITLDSPANDSIQSSATLINLTITDSGGISQVLYNWGDGTNVSLVPPYRVALPPLPPGTPQMTFVLRVYAQDTAGNWASQTYAFTVGGATTDFFTVEVVLLALVVLTVVLWRKKQKSEAHKT